jgi:hypothetical protein
MGVIGGEVPVFVLWDMFMELTFFFEVCQAGSVCGAMSFWVVYAVHTLMQAWVCSCTEGGSVFLTASGTSVCFCLTVSNIVSKFLAFQTSFGSDSSLHTVACFPSMNRPCSMALFAVFQLFNPMMICATFWLLAQRCCSFMYLE